VGDAAFGGEVEAEGVGGLRGEPTSGKCPGGLAEPVGGPRGARHERGESCLRVAPVVEGGAVGIALGGPGTAEDGLDHGAVVFSCGLADSDETDGDSENSLARSQARRFNSLARTSVGNSRNTKDKSEPMPHSGMSFSATTKSRSMRM
jgi:hypothetical protein